MASVSAKFIFFAAAANITTRSSFLPVFRSCAATSPLLNLSHRRRVLQITNVLKTEESPAASPKLDPVRKVQKPTILVSEKLSEAGLEVLREFREVECCYDLSPEDLCSKISLCDALIVRSGTKVTEDPSARRLPSRSRSRYVGRWDKLESS